MPNEFRDHLRNERLQRIHSTWKYLKPHQQMWLFVRALWWALPSVIGMVESIQRFWLNRVIYRLYKAHWI
jgi:hypothetical protein